VVHSGRLRRDHLAVDDLRRIRHAQLNWYWNIRFGSLKFARFLRRLRIQATAQTDFTKRAFDMAGFKAHMTFSTACGAAYGVAGYAYGMPLIDCLLSGTLCSASGMLPDLDSNSGKPVREMSAFLAAIVPMLMINRMQSLGAPHQVMVLCGVLGYLFIRFVVAEIFSRYTVHRGMWHSIPAALSVGLLAYLICQCDEFGPRLFRASAVFLGFMSHLLLDEIWSVQFSRGKLRLKKSFGTAIKFWATRGMWPNVSTYGKLILLVGLVIGDPMLMERIEPPEGAAAFSRTARNLIDEASDDATRTIEPIILR
jgi:hypothetical protein